MILDEISEHKRGEVDAAKTAVTLAELEDRIARQQPARNFRSALRQPGVSLIAEVKRASPARGDLMLGADPVDLASVYQHGGARCISVLTDSKYFKGSLDDLSTISKHVSIPCLRKDFTIDAYQIYEARAAGADAILLIMRLLSDAQIKEYIGLAASLGMAALVETHDLPEIERAIDCGAHIIGINNRDLSNFTVDLKTTLELKKHVPGGKVLVSESGITTREEVSLLEDSGVDAVLIGEALMTSQNIEATIHELLGVE